MSRRTVKLNGPHPVDLHVGSRIRTARTLAGLSQETLGERLGVTFQQLQKYERGANRVSASKLHALSKALGLPVGHFFEGLEGPAEGEPDADVMQTRETLELVRAYYHILNPTVRKRLVDLVRSIAPGADEGQEAA